MVMIQFGTRKELGMLINCQLAACSAVPRIQESQNYSKIKKGKTQWMQIKLRRKGNTSVCVSFGFFAPLKKNKLLTIHLNITKIEEIWCTLTDGD